MRILQVLLEVDLELRLERLQGSERARGQYDGPWLEPLDLIETDTSIEAQELQNAVLDWLG